MVSRVLLVDDHPVFRKGLRGMLDDEQDLEVVGEAGDGRQAIELVTELEPDVVVMDISMKGLNGIEATAQIHTASPGTKIVALSIHSGRRYVEGMLGAGATGYILKDTAPEELVEGIRTVRRGEVYLSSPIAGVVVSGYRESLDRRSLEARIEALTARDRDILALLVEGDSDAQIAAALELDEDTVFTARCRLLDEFGVQDVTELAESIREFGVLDRASEGRKAAESINTSTARMRQIRKTKLYPPKVPNDHIHRPRLIEILEDGVRTPLTVISAPAGYGKSQLCSSWLQTCGLRSTWLSLDSDDDDLRRFLEHVLASVGCLFPEALDEIRSLVDAACLPPVSVLTDTLANDLDQIEERFVLVLDDFHHIHSGLIHDLVWELLRHPPRPLHFVLITRRDPPFPLAGLRADGRLKEVRARDLQFTGAETAALLEALTGITPDADALAAVQRRMEGWVVGLRLVALALRHADSADVLLTGMSGGIQDIREYLLREVLAAQPTEIQDCMLKTSILDRFCEPLCTAVCGGETPPVSPVLEGADFLEALERSNLFTIPLDTDGTWFRFHHLFQELLLVELQRRLGAQEIADLHSRAATWFEGHDMIGEALYHRLKCGDPAGAAGIVERHIQQEMSRGSWHTIKEWLAKLPESEVLSRPELLLGRAFMYAFSVEFGKIPSILERVEDLVGDRMTTPLVSRAVVAFRGVCAMNAGDADRALEDLDEAIEYFAGHPNMGAFIVSHWVAASLITGQGERARAMASTWLKDRTNEYRTAFLRNGLRILNYNNGDLDEVLRGIEADREQARTLNLENTMAWCDYFSGICRLQRGLIAEAIPHLEATVERRFNHWKGAAIDALAVLAIARQAHGIPEEAAKAIQLLRGFVSEADSTQSKLSDSCETRLQIMQGRLEPGGWWRETPVSDTTVPMLFFFEKPDVTRCRALISEGTAAGLTEASRLLQRYLDLKEVHHNTIRRIELRTLQAAAFDKQAETDKALAAIQVAVELAAPGGFVFPFLELGRPMFELLKRHRKLGQHDLHVERILAAFEAQTVAATPVSTQRVPGSYPLVEKLTNRELDVLEMLDQRLFDKEIAAKLHISTSTVNSHCKKIYQKLDVSNRRQAVATAIELGILGGDRS